MSNHPVEAKVKAASTGAFLAGLAVAMLNAVVADSSLLGPLPSWLQAPLLALVPTALAWLGGYQARHTPRSIV
ncbi:holin [Streptomyces globisporus]|uniref:holin n=1 Tax=Streptomyces globisporus TaxID=1908 RepID=UPI0036DF4E0A